MGLRVIVRVILVFLSSPFSKGGINRKYILLILFYPHSSTMSRKTLTGADGRAGKRHVCLQPGKKHRILPGEYLAADQSHNVIVCNERDQGEQQRDSGFLGVHHEFLAEWFLSRGLDTKKQ